MDRERADVRRYPAGRASVSPLVAAGMTLLPALTVFVANCAATITTHFGGVDGGELAATVLSGGVAHPTGYPTYLLLARAALFVLPGEPAHRVALLSGYCAGGAAACTAVMVAGAGSRARRRRFGRLQLLAGVYAGLALALGPRFWSQAIIPEVYALHMLWLALCGLLFVAWLRSGRRWPLLLGALCLGLGLGTHVTLLALAPGAALAWAVVRRPQLTPTLSLAAVVALAAGLSVYALLPLWSAREAVPSWGDERSLQGFWSQISAADYRYLAGRVPWSQRLTRLGFAAHDLLAQPGPTGVMLAIWLGLPYGWRRERALVVLSLVVALLSLVFALGYGGADSTVYLMPWTWAWCIWAGMGALYAGRLLAATRRSNRRLWLAGEVVLLTSSLLWPVVAHYHALDLHGDTAYRDRTIHQLLGLPPNAVLITDDDAATFGVWYVQTALGTRRDVVVLDVRLLDRPWYRAQARRLLGLPGSATICAALRSSGRPLLSGDPDGRATPFDPANAPDAMRCG